MSGVVKGKLYQKIEDAYIDEFFESGERWFNYFWDTPEERQDGKEGVRAEAESLFGKVLDEAKTDLLQEDNTNEYIAVSKKKFEKWFGKLEKP